MLRESGFTSVIDDIELFPVNLLGFVPNLLTTLAIAIAAGVGGARRLGVSRGVVTLWLLAVLVPIAYTWTPSWGYETGACTSGVWPWDSAGPSPFYEVSTNILLMIPAGSAAWLWPAGIQRRAAFVSALAIPVVIETVQRWAPQLASRACQVSDVAFNLVGVCVGFAGAAMLSKLHAEISQRRHQPPSVGLG